MQRTTGYERRLRLACGQDVDHQGKFYLPDEVVYLITGQPTLAFALKAKQLYTAVSPTIVFLMSVIFIAIKRVFYLILTFYEQNILKISQLVQRERTFLYDSDLTF